MTSERTGRVAIVYPGDREVRQNATPDNNRFASLFQAFAESGLQAEPAVYHDDFCDEVRQQLLHVDAALVWVNPIEDGRDRARLDAMLRDVASASVFVSTHPDIILKLGTKEVLYETRDMAWGCDTHLYRSLDQMRYELPGRLVNGKARVLKQYRGHSGIGVWKVQWPVGAATQVPQPQTLIRVRHAKRGSIEEEITLGEFLERCEPYFDANGRMIDQAYQERLPDGMIRCYLVHDKVVGFGHQAINALFPAPPGTASTEAPQPGPRLYYPPDKPEFQALKRKLEQTWVHELQGRLDIDTARLPILWDCDFLFGPKGEDGEDTYVLCEINVSSVAPYPESAVSYIVEATAASIQTSRPTSPAHRA
jgi:hypothetical protein